MKEIYTIGHSTRTFEDLVKILNHYGIKILVDVRHFPRSKHNPQFNQKRLEKELRKDNIFYKWLENLGGFRKGGYKRYTKTQEFKSGIKKLKKLARKFKTAIMCAEIIWLKCHRRYIADTLKREKWKVFHIFDEKKLEKHLITRKRKIKCDKFK